MQFEYESEMLRLNEKIKQLMWRIEQTMSRNSQLEVENKRLSRKVDEMKEICTQTSSTNVKYKMQLEREMQSRVELLEGNAKLKKKVNELAGLCYEQNEKIKVLESNLSRSTSATMRASRVPVTIIGNISEIIQKTDPKTSSEYIDLEEKYGELEKEYQEALAIIDELEFELDDIDYLEIEIHRLREENERLKKSEFCIVSPPAAAFAFAAACEETDNADDMASKERDDDDKEHVQDVVEALMNISKRKIVMQQKLEKLRAARQ